jgi:hypothetical protein
MMYTLLTTAGVSGLIFGVIGYLLGKQGVAGVIADVTNAINGIKADIQVIKAQINPVPPIPGPHNVPVL